MNPLPDILTSAGFWASIATLWSAAGAWFTFVSAVTESKRQTYRGVLNLMSGIETELDLIEPWASPYLQDSDEALAKKYSKWFNPSRQIFTFDVPTLNDLTNSPYLRYVAPIVPDFVRLNHSIRRLFDFIKIYQSFAHSDAELYSEVFVSVSQGKRPVTEKAVKFSNIIFGMNRKIHLELIGGEDATDEGCLYKALRRARKTLKDFKAGFRRERLPKWYWILHIVAGYLAVNGAWQVARWVRWRDLWAYLLHS